MPSSPTARQLLTQSRLALRLLDRVLTDMDDPVDAERLLRPRVGGVGGVADLDFPERPFLSSGFPRGGAERGGILASNSRFGDFDLDLEIDRDGERPRPRAPRNGGVTERSRVR